MMMSKKGEEENDKTKPFLSRKQRKLALQRGEVVLESNHSSDDKNTQALLAAAEAAFR